MLTTRQHPHRPSRPALRQPAPAPVHHHRGIKLLTTLIVIGALVFAWHAFAHQNKSNPPSVTAKTTASTKTKTTPATSTTKKPAPVVVATPNPCADNTLSQLALVSISKRHMWACDGTTVVYNSAVVTGMENLPADLTPVGTYHVYGKETDQHLIGSDSTGSWNDFVNYWMPFLDNQYGQYGFHDATWRPSTAFGNISPYSSNASHGCVELPLATAKWLYNWVVIGTTVTIES